MALGTPTTTALDPVTLVMELKQEADSKRDKHHARWQKNKDGYGGEHYVGVTVKEGQSQYVINLTRNAVNGFLSVMTQEPPESHIVPMETDAPGMYYIKREAGGAIGNALQIITQGVQSGQIASDQVPIAAINAVRQMDDGQLLGDVPIIPEHFRALSNSTNPLTGQPFLSEDGVFRFDDITVGELLQRVTDGVWNRYNWEKKIQDVQLDALVIGHRDVIVEYDDTVEDVRIHTVMERDSWIDPNPKVKDISDAAYYIYGEVMAVEDAVKRFPQHEITIRANAEDPGSATSLDGESLSEKYTEIDWERDMAIVYTCWIRDQVMSINTQAEDGETITENIRGLREIKIVGSALISDGPSRYTDIPAVRFKFITIVDSSYSIGLPQMLADPQEVVNRLFSNLSDHTRFLAHPMIWVLEEIAEMLQNKGAIFNRSNDPITVPMGVLTDEIKRDPVNFVDPPSLDASHIALLDRAMSIFHDVANQGDVTRGIATSKAESGIAIGQLQQAANRTLNLASKWMDHAVARLNKLTYQHMINFMPVDKWLKYTDKYPEHVLEDMIKRAREAEFNVKVQTAGTKQQKRLEDQQKALLLRQNGAISLETLLKKMEVDNPEQEAQRIFAEQAAQAQSQAQLQLSEQKAELEKDVTIENLKTENEGKLEVLKNELEQKLEQVKADLEIKVEKAKPKPQAQKSAA